MRDRKILLVVIAVVAIAAIGFFVYRRSTQKKQASAQRDQAQAAADVIFERVQQLYYGLQRNGRRRSIQAARRARARRPLEAR